MSGGEAKGPDAGGSDAAKTVGRGKRARLRLPSLDRVVAAGVSAARRFPEVAVCGAVSAVSAVIMLEAESPDTWLGLLRVSSLGIPLFIAVTLFGERRDPGSALRWAPRLLAAGFLVLLYFDFERTTYLNVAQRYVHLSATFHLLASVAPHLGAREPRGFWQYNRALLFRFVLATFYGAAVFLGLALALAALQNLFGVDVPPLHYPRLLFLVAFLLHPLFFLAGLPRDFAALDAERRYPGGLRVFSQYVMLPLVALYVVILTAYMGRVLTTGSWPSGWISYLVSGLAVAGILSLLLVHPDRMGAARNWIDRYALAFWIAIVPAAAMVLLALWQRVDQYGITERRYLLGAMALWLAATALHAAVTRTREIKGIPLTLALLGVVTFVGPWSAYAVAERSQVGRLEALLGSHGALVDGRVMPDTVAIPYEAFGQAEAVVFYLVEHHGTDGFEGWYAEEGTASDEAAEADATAEADVAAEGEPGAEVAAVDTVPSPPPDSRERVAAILRELRIRPGPSGLPVQLSAAEPPGPVEADGFDLLVAIGPDGRGLVGGDTVRFAFSGDSLEVVMWLAGREEARAPLAPLVARAGELRGDAPGTRLFTLGVEAERYEVPAAELVVDLVGDAWRARLALRSLTLYPQAGGRLVPGHLVPAAALLRRAEPPG